MKRILAATVTLALLAGARVRAADAEEVAGLVKKLKGDNPAECLRAAGELEKLGPDARDAVPALVEALKNKNDPALPAAAARALGRVGKAAVPALADALKEKDAQV